VTFPRKTALSALAVTLALVPAGAAHAISGLGGYVTDADSGLGVNQASVTFAQDGGAGTPPLALTDPTGRCHFSALSGVTGRLDVSGPAGWLSTAIDGISVPVGAFVQQDVALRRNWATVPGGARLASATDDTNAGAGCGPAAAVDGDRNTGWSASASRPPTDPPTLTVELPATVDVDGLGLEAGSVCGHPAGAALGRYRIDTSPDGASWTTAADGQLAASDRGHAVVVPPAAGASGVRFVRVAMLGAQDAAATEVDLRELQVLGKGPNVPPQDGQLTFDIPRPQPLSTVRLTASFTDPDTSIVRYLWDFDGDNVWDQATLGPRVAHVWAGEGTYNVTVGARDFRGALGTTTASIRVAPPGAPVEPVLDRKPEIAFDPADGPGVPFRVRCSVKCRITADIRATPALAYRLDLSRLTLGRMKRTYAGGGLADYRVSLSRQSVRKLRKTKLRKARVIVRVKVVDAKKRKASRKKIAILR
jgi:hypothetical protein